MAFCKYSFQEGFLISDFIVLRSAVTIICSCMVLAWIRQDPIFGVKKEMYGPLIQRGLFGGIGIFCFNFGIYVLPLSHAILVGMVNQFAASIFAHFMNAEPIFRYELVGMVVISLGISMFAISKSQQPESE
jgi:drug/metabolite transporter (DMT)-like permease